MGFWGRIGVGIVVMSCMFLLCLIVEAVNPESTELARSAFTASLVGTSFYMAFGGRSEVA